MATTATLGGGVYPNGLETTYYWQYGPTIYYGTQTQPVDVGAGQAPIEVPAALRGLAPGTTYHYRLVAENADGIAYGYDSELTTVALPVDALAPTTAGAGTRGADTPGVPGRLDARRPLVLLPVAALDRRRHVDEHRRRDRRPRTRSARPTPARTCAWP